MLAQVVADRQVPAGGVEVVALAEQLGHADVHVRRSPEHGRGVLGGDLQSSLVVAHRVAETALRDAEVGQRDRAADHVRAASRPVPASPCRPSTSGAPPRDHRSSSARARSGTPPPRGRDGRRDRPVRAPAARASGCRPRRRRPGPARRGTWRSLRGAGGTRRSSTTTISPEAPGLPASSSTAAPTAPRPGAAARRPRTSPVDMRAPTYPMASTGRTPNNSSGSASSQRRSVASCRAPLHRRGRPVRPGPPPARSPPPARAWSIAADRSPFRSYQSLARTVQRRDAVGLLVEQARPQHVAEEVVVAVPPTAVVERDQEEVAPLERLEHGLAAVLAGDGIAQRAA